LDVVPTIVIGIEWWAKRAIAPPPLDSVDLRILSRLIKRASKKHIVFVYLAPPRHTKFLSKPLPV